MATITTKFNTGDEVYFLDCDKMKIRKGTISSVSAHFYDSMKSINYGLRFEDKNDCNEVIDENRLYNSKQEILELIK